MKGLLSFIGAYKVLGRVLPNGSDVVDPLECALTGLQSNDKLLWDENLTLKFKAAKEHLSRHRSIVLPCPSNTLWIVTDRSVTKRGLGATLYISRAGRQAAQTLSLQAPVVQRLDNAIHRIFHYPADSVVCFVNTYPLDTDLSGG